jgi:hypothetical protein
MEHWNGILDWSAGLECWRAWSMILLNHSVEVLTGLSGCQETNRGGSRGAEPPPPPKLDV